MPHSATAYSTTRRTAHLHMTRAVAISEPCWGHRRRREELWDTRALAAPTKGGHLRLGLAGGSTTDSLDPSPWSDTFMVMLGFSVRGNLVELLPDGTCGRSRGVVDLFAGATSGPSSCARAWSSATARPLPPRTSSPRSTIIAATRAVRARRPLQCRQRDQGRRQHTVVVAFRPAPSTSRSR